MLDVLACARRVQPKNHVHTSALMYSHRFDDTHPLDRLCQEDPERSYCTGSEEILNRPRERLHKLDCTEQSGVSPKQAFQFWVVEDATRITHSTLKRFESSFCYLHILSFERCRFHLATSKVLEVRWKGFHQTPQAKGKAACGG